MGSKLYYLILDAKSIHTHIQKQRFHAEEHEVMRALKE